MKMLMTCNPVKSPKSNQEPLLGAAPNFQPFQGDPTEEAARLGWVKKFPGNGFMASIYFPHRH